MYHGEVNVEQKNLEKFLETASDLKIKGLAHEQVPTVYAALSHTSTNNVLQSQSHSSSNLLQSSNLQSYEEISKVGMEYSEDRVRKLENFDDIASSTDGHEYQDIPEQAIYNDLMKYQNGVWLCNVCGKTDRNKYNIKYHTEIHTDTSAHYCSYCGKSYRTKNSLRVHKYKAHASEKLIQQLGHVI